MKQSQLFSKKAKPSLVRSKKGCPFREGREGLLPGQLIIYEDIQRHRLQLLIWSRAYYELDFNIVSDQEFDKVGKELVELQLRNPGISEKVAYADDFRTWDGTTGYHLPLRDPWVIRKTDQIIEICRRNNSWNPR